MKIFPCSDDHFKSRVGQFLLVIISIFIPTGQNEENIDLHHGMWYHMLDVAWTDLSSGYFV